jgi:hypothetical protein
MAVELFGGLVIVLFGEDRNLGQGKGLRGSLLFPMPVDNRKDCLPVHKPLIARGKASWEGGLFTRFGENAGPGATMSEIRGQREKETIIQYAVLRIPPNSAFPPTQ